MFAKQHQKDLRHQTSDLSCCSDGSRCLVGQSPFVSTAARWSGRKTLFASVLAVQLAPYLFVRLFGLFLHRPYLSQAAVPLCRPHRAWRRASHKSDPGTHGILGTTQIAKGWGWDKKGTQNKRQRRKCSGSREQLSGISQSGDFLRWRDYCQIS